MLKTLARDTILAADRAGMRRPIASVASLVMKAKGREQRFSVDSDGDWVNAQPDATFVSPNILTSIYDDMRVEICDLWCHQFTPSAGATVLDIGAGIGDEALVFSHIVGSTGRVISIEAHPHTYSCLQKTIDRSGLTNVTALQLAIADKEGELLIADDENHIGNSVVLHGDGIRVPAKTIDQLIEDEGIEQLTLLKMNIEGAERFAIQGMSAAREITRYLVISCHDFIADRNGLSADALRTREEVLDTLSDWGWTIARRKGDPRPWVRDYIYAQNPNFR
ncbi:MAG: FkbM family methyltransferase [Paracoccaceae bacterium]